MFLLYKTTVIINVTNKRPFIGGSIMIKPCGKWVRKEGVAAFRCGDNTKDGLVLCRGCLRNELRILNESPMRCPYCGNC